jgi:hypothetical protein
MGGRQTIGDTARVVLAEVALGEWDYLPISADLIFGGDKASRARYGCRAWLASRKRPDRIRRR